MDPTNDLRQLINQTQTLMETVYNWDAKGTAEDLGAQLNALISALGELDRLPFGQMHVPIDLITAVDAGESPDSYWQAVMVKLQQLNALANGRVQTLSLFLDALEERQAKK
jgi:hypothetical protein